MSAEKAPPVPAAEDISGIHSYAEEMRSRGARLITIVARENADGTFELIYVYDVGGCVRDRRFHLSPDQEVDTISDVFLGATNLEREVVDLFGLRFKGKAPGLLLETGKSPCSPLRRPPEGPPEKVKGKEGDGNV